MFPFEIKKVDEPQNSELLKDFIGERNGFCQVGPKKWCLPLDYKEHAENYYNLKLRQDDLWIVTYPRSGTTWTQELLWLLNNNLDFETAAKIPLFDRFPFFEFNMIINKEFSDEIIELNDKKPEAIQQMEKFRLPGYIRADELPSPRHIKSHLPLSLLPPKLINECKVVYVARNPKDVCASFYHHNKLFTAHNYVGDFPKYWDYFEKDLITYSPYWDHLQEAWEIKEHPNLMFLFYEEMINDLDSCIRKLANFLNKTVTEEQIDKLKKHLHIDNFRKVPLLTTSKIKGMINEGAEGFIRRGKIGGNKEFTEEMESKANAWIDKNLSKTDLRFPIN